MKKRLTYILLFILPMLAASGSFAQESMMGDIDYPFLQKLIATAKQNYAQVKVRQEQVNIAANTYKVSKLAWFDAVSFSYIYNPNNTLNLTTNNAVGTGTSTGNTVNSSLFNNYQAAITLNVGNLIRTPNNTKIAKSNLNIAMLEQETYLGSLETQVKKLYFTYVEQMASLRLKTTATQNVAISLAMVKDKFTKNEIAIDVYTKEATALSEVNQLKLDAEVGVLNAKIALEELIGKKLEEIK